MKNEKKKLKRRIKRTMKLFNELEKCKAELFALDGLYGMPKIMRKARSLIVKYSDVL